jgi:hypothetical protein
MKAGKNFEAVFLIAAVVATFASYATAEVPTPHTLARTQLSTQLSAPAAEVPMQVVVVTGHRLSAAEKARLD